MRIAQRGGEQSTEIPAAVPALPSAVLEVSGVLAVSARRIRIPVFGCGRAAGLVDQDPGAPVRPGSQMSSRGVCRARWYRMNDA
jgi:hypothetical protein